MATESKHPPISSKINDIVRRLYTTFINYYYYHYILPLIINIIVIVITYYLCYNNELKEVDLFS